MAEKKSALGKGLGALIPLANEINRGSGKTHFSGSFTEQEKSDMHSATSIMEVPIDKIVTNPYQPRTTFDEEALEELAESIRTLGLIQPITVRQIGGKFQIISGERRFRASKMAGLSTIPAYIIKTDDQGLIEMAIVENIQRENLNVIEVALSFKRLIEECHLTQEQMADRVGKKRTSVTNFLRLLKLPASVQSNLMQGTISMGHAKCLLSLEKESDIEKFSEMTIKKELSVRKLEEKIREFLTVTDREPDSEKDVPELPDSYYRLIEKVGKYFNNNVTVRRDGKGSGRLTVSFENDAQVEEFLKAIENA